MKYDVVIVGAGPAGCSAAYDLCSCKKSVLLIDKVAFPRVKPCAGGLTIKTLKALRYSVRPIIKRVCHDMVVGKGLEKTTLFKSAHPVCAMSVRSEFDHYCLKKTLEIGADFKMVGKIKAITSFDDRVEIATNIGTIQSKYLIGADGANSLVRKLSGLFPQVRKGIAIEAKVFFGKEDLPQMEFDFGAVKQGYGWLFPKDDHVNVGIYSNSLSNKLTKKSLEKYAKIKLGNCQLDHVVGHYIGLGGGNYTPEADRIFLIGDAAGLVDPLLGEGIYNAIKSGQNAAEAIFYGLKGGSALTVFQQKMQTIKRDVQICAHSAGWFYKLPSLGYFALTFPTTRYLLMKGFAMGLTFNETKKQSFSLPFKRVEKINGLVGMFHLPVNTKAPVSLKDIGK